MVVRKDTIFEQFLAPIFRTFLMDEAALAKYYQSIDWETECDRFRQPDLDYPSYYRNQNFHSIEGGYLTPGAAVTYDPVTQYVLPPNETWVRQGLIDRIRCYPQRILDLGCGTGSMTLMLKQAFPQSEVIGLDLSPYMLVVAEDKSRKVGCQIHWQHGQAEQTPYPNESFDLITAALLFHETPPDISRSILQECFRLLKTGGEVLILDGNQATLRQTKWLTEIFEEPYIQNYADGSVDAWMGASGFGDIRTDDWWWMHQVTRGVKPMARSTAVEFTDFDRMEQMGWAMG